MGTRKPQAPRPRSAGSQVGIPELYRQRLAKQSSIKQDLGKLKLMFAKDYFFGRPVFGPPPMLDGSSVINQETDPKIHRQLSDAGKYRHILALVRRQTKREARLWLLAWWLSQEGVCEPEDIVGIELFRRLAKKTFRCLSASDFDHADRVRKCLPYFEKLLSDFATYKEPVPDLVKMGYDEAAVRATIRKRSAIPAACEWLANRRDSVVNVDALTLQNAYSRIYGPKRRSVHKSTASLKPKK